MRGIALKQPTLLEKLLRLVYPVRCMVCDTLLREDALLSLCDTCYSMLPRCEKGFERMPEIPYVQEVFGACYYDEGIDSAIHSMKFNHQPKLAATFGLLLYEELIKKKIPAVHVILPVPMYHGKQRRRGYNQSELIAGELSRYLNVPIIPDLLLKTRNTRPQVGLKREERLHNLEGAFRVENKQDLLGKTVLLVDDVVTTGTTLNTCAKILYENGADRIYAAVIAIAEK